MHTHTHTYTYTLGEQPDEKERKRGVSKVNEDEWTKGSFRQMKNEGTMRKREARRPKRNGIERRL